MDEFQRPINSSRCVRCRAEMMAQFAFCAQCGLPRDSLKSSNSSSVVFSSSTKPDTSKSKNKKARKVKINSDNAKSHENETKLNLPAEVIAAIEAKLSTPVLDNSIITKRLELQYKTQLLEIKNAEGIEHVALNKKAESVALNNLDVSGVSQSTIEPNYSLHYESKSRATLPMNLKENSHSSSKHHKKTTKITKIPSKSYLAEVESVSTHYKRYLDRLKQLEGLRAALMEPPPLPSQQLKQRDQQFYERSISDVYGRFISSMTDLPLDINDVEAVTSDTTVLVPGATEEQYGELVTTPTDYKHHEIGSISIDNPDIDNPNSKDETTSDINRNSNVTGITIVQGNTSETTPAGLAFMWGPIFNPNTSQVSDFPVTDHASNYQSEEEGVVMLDPSTLLLPSSPSQSPARTPSSMHPTPTAAADISPSQLDAAASHPPPRSGSPVAMFWGNIMNNELAPADDRDSPQTRSPSQRLSPSVNMYGDYHADSSSDADDSVGCLQDDAYSNNEDATEKELPMWIEALAAETADIREKLSADDAAVMHRLGEKLQNLDDRRLCVMSQRALLVQYSTDAVVEEYREKLKLMKANMGLHGLLSRPGTGLNGSEEEQSAVVAPLQVLTDLDEERSILEEEEQGPRQEALQRTEEAAEEQRRASVKTTESIQQSKNSEQSYKEEELNDSIECENGFTIAENKENAATGHQDHAQLEEEQLAVQELIQSLALAHKPQQHIAELSAGETAKDAEAEPKDSLREDSAKDGLIDRHITERLQSQEVQEHSEIERRQQAQADEDLAIKQWLVAVSAFDAERARKQTLRTLQLEAWEDVLNEKDEEEDSDDDNDTHSHASNISNEKDKKEVLASAMLDIPENHSLTRIKSLYRQSSSKMLALLSELTVDFTIDQTETMDFYNEARTKVHFARKVLRTSSAIDHKVALEYRNFLNYCALRRTAIALKLSEAMKHVTSLEKSYRERYAEATNAFKSTPDAMLASASGMGMKHIQSSKHMRAIQKSAELDIAQQGAVVQRLQAEEAKLILDIRQEQYVLSEVLSLWQSRHSRVLSRYSLAYKRFNALLEASSNNGSST